MAVVAPSTQPFEHLVLDFLAYLEFERGLSRNTLEAYRSDLAQFGGHLERTQTDALSVAHDDLAGFVASLAQGDGERPPVAGAEVTLSAGGAKVLARASTDSGGTCGLPLPLDVEPSDMFIIVQHGDYNPRRLRLDGTPVREDLRVLLYGATP